MRLELLELAASRVEQADVYESEVDLTEVVFRQGKFFAQETKLTHGLGLRVIKNGKVGFAASTNPERLEEQVRAAIDAAAFGQTARFDLPGPAEPSAVPTFDNRTLLVNIQKMREWGGDLIEALNSRMPELKVDLHFSRCYREIGVANTRGVDLSFERVELELSIAGLLVQDGIFWVYDYVNLSGGQSFPLDQVAERVVNLARLGKQKATLKSGDYPVVVMPFALPQLLLPLLIAVNGKNRQKGTSPLINRENQPVLSAEITLADNRLRPFGTASAPFDGEGLPAVRNVLFERGVFKGFIYDLATAAACGTDSTGSAVRSYSSLPAPGLSNIEIEPGTAELESVIKDIPAGILVYGFLGGGMSNLLAGEVALNVSCGYKIEKGNITGRLKDVSVAGNVYELFQRVEAVGATQRDLGDYYLPFIKFSSLRVACKE
ncbi:MAG: TldD/PmbA family protein [candidate division WOR-3 bacterium]